MNVDVDNVNASPPVSPRAKRKLDENTVSEQPASQIRRTDTDTRAMDDNTMDVDKDATKSFVNVFETPKISIPPTQLDFKIQSGFKDAYSLLTHTTQIEQNKEICKQVRDAISQTFTIPNYANDVSLFNLILDSIIHNNMNSNTFYTIVETCLNPDSYYKTDLTQLCNNAEKRIFVETFRTYVNSLKNTGQLSSAYNAAEESQMDSAVVLAPDKSIQAFHPGLSLIHKGTEINYGMSALFTTRIKSLSGDTTFNTLVSSILALFTTIQGDEFKPQLIKAYDEWKNVYNLTKFYIDAGDLIHDINKRRTDNLNANNYYTGLITVGAQLGQPSVSVEIDKCFTSSDVNNIKTVSQEKTRKMRSDALAIILQTNPTVSTLIPKPETIALTQETGYFELINQISIIYGENSAIGKFVYRESGRELQIAGIVNYFKALSEDSKTIFIQKCVEYCDKNFVNDEYVKKIIENVDPPKLQVDLKSITSFDGCGTTKGLSHDTINIAAFEYVFGFYKYIVYTVFDKTNGEFNHLVIVTSYIEPIKPLAVFGFFGNITINMLLGVEKIPATREGEGSKGGLKPIKAIYSMLVKVASVDSYLLPTTVINSMDDNVTMYYDESIALNSGVRQLLFLGNKTIGDLIVTTYDDVKTVTTVDSLIADSTMYNFLAGTSDILQSVWRQTGSKGWVFTPGMFKADLRTKSNFIAIQLLGSLMLLQVVLTPGLSNDTNPRWQPLVITYSNIINTICSNCITPNLRILTRFRVLLNYTFVDFSNHVTGSYVDVPSVYNECMLQLLIIENKLIQTRVKTYVNTLATYITNRASLAITNDANILFLNQIYLLPKLETLFFSNISNIASNNQEAYDLPGLIEMLIPINNITISSITTTSIVFGYNSKSKYIDQSYFKKNLISPEEVHLADPAKIPDAPRSDPTRTYTFTIPYTIESLINLFATGKLDATNKSDVSNRIIMFFRNNISALGINDDYSSTELTNLNQTLIDAGIMAQNTTLFSYESTFAEEDNAECGQECTGGECFIKDDNTHNDWNVDSQQVVQVQMMELGGTNKKTRKKRKTKQKRKTKGGKKQGKNKTKKIRKNKKNTKTRRRQ